MQIIIEYATLKWSKRREKNEDTRRKSRGGGGGGGGTWVTSNVIPRTREMLSF